LRQPGVLLLLEERAQLLEVAVKPVGLEAEHRLQPAVWLDRTGRQANESARLQWFAVGGGLRVRGGDRGLVRDRDFGRDGRSHELGWAGVVWGWGCMGCWGGRRGACPRPRFRRRGQERGDQEVRWGTEGGRGVRACARPRGDRGLGLLSPACEKANGRREPAV